MIRFDSIQFVSNALIFSKVEDDMNNLKGIYKPVRKRVSVLKIVILLDSFERIKINLLAQKLHAPFECRPNFALI